ncbi:MAG TPA: hypothetical protein VGK29_07140 [Paludibaculum sp.]|jgi:serine/threonine-protein kinase
MKEQPPEPEAIRQSLARIVASPGFSEAGRLAAFLQHLVERTLAGDTARLKESVLGVEVFQREAGYDPRIDPIVRVEARRLRARLEDYYNSHGKNEPLRISLPKGAYRPSFEAIAEAPAAAPALRRWRIYAGVAGLLLALMAVSLYILRRPGPASPATVAVLPFTNVGGDPQNAYFSDGLSEEILDRLARLPGLKVVARSVMAQFHSQPPPLAALAAQVKATLIVEGSVRRQGDRLRVTARLTNPADGAALWSQSYERDVRDVFAIQDEIAQSIANALRVNLRGGEGQLSALRSTANIEAYNAYLKGRHQANLSSIEGMKRAVDYFEEALRLEPGYAPAHANLSLTYSMLGYYNALPAETAWPSARRAADRAIELAPQLPDAHAALGHLLALHDWQWKEAEVEFRRAIQLDDSSPVAHGLYALSVLMPQARWPEALAEFRKAIELDPLAAFTNFAYGFALLGSGDAAEAVNQYRRTLELKNIHPDMYWDYGMALSFAGRPKEAGDALRQALRARGAARVELRGFDAFLAGDATRARRDILEMEREALAGREQKVDLARFYAMLGDPEMALTWLERALAVRESQVVWAKADPRLHSLQGLPRHHQILAKLGL